MNKIREQIEKETEENFDRIYPKPYPIGMEEETERYRNEVVYHSEIRSVDEKDGFCRFYIIGERPELIHGLLRQSLYIDKNDNHRVSTWYDTQTEHI